MAATDEHVLSRGDANTVTGWRYSKRCLIPPKRLKRRSRWT